MLYKYFYRKKLTGLQGLSIEKKLKKNQNTIHIHCKLERKKHKCPCCGKLTNTIHDYREQVIKDIPAFGKVCFSFILKREDIAVLAVKGLLKRINFCHAITE